MRILCFVACLSLEKCELNVVGIEQAMNLIVASFLIYMSEEQCFWCLSVLCDRMLPGYYR